MKRIKNVGGNRRKKKEQRLLWNTTSGRKTRLERRVCADTVLSLEQIQELASEGKIKGFSAVLEGSNNEIHIVVAGSFYDDPLAANGGVSKLKSTLDFFPEHPVLKLSD